MKKHISGALSLLGLTAGYLMLRFPLFLLHGMKQWSFILFIVGVIIVISSLALSKRILPVFTLAGYTVGFFFGYRFQFNYGMGLNSLWIIWTCVYLGMVLIGISAEIHSGKQ